MPSGDLRGAVLKYMAGSDLYSDLTDSSDLEALRFIPFKGTSMLPGLKEKDILAVLPIKESLPKIGEIVLMKRSEDEFIAHRLLGFDRITGSIVTRGDNQLFKDKPWDLAQCHCRVLAFWRNNVLMITPSPPSIFKRCISITCFWLFKLIRRL